jgi:hypothetical protein
MRAVEADGTPPPAEGLSAGRPVRLSPGAEGSVSLTCAQRLEVLARTWRLVGTCSTCPLGARPSMMSASSRAAC